eukprot:8613640-Pyramimonas_sp.AAC.2
MSGSIAGSSTRRIALAKRRLSQFVTLSGRTPLAGKAAASPPEWPSRALGRKKRRLSLKSAYCCRTCSSPAADTISSKAPCNTFTATSSNALHAP